MLAPIIAREAHGQGGGAPGLQHPQGGDDRPAASSPRARSRARRSCAWCAIRSSSTRARSARCGGSRTTSPRSRRATSAVSRSRATATSRKATSSRPSRSRRGGDLDDRPPPKSRPAPASVRAGASAVTVGIARVTLFLGESHSLKEKRMVLRQVKDLVRNKFNVSIAEVSENDRWQRAVLGWRWWERSPLRGVGARRGAALHPRPRLRCRTSSARSRLVDELAASIYGLDPR